MNQTEILGVLILPVFRNLDDKNVKDTYNFHSPI